MRSIPQGQCLVAAGLEQVIHYILNLRFTNADLKWLQDSKTTHDMSDDFLDYLRDFKFGGDVCAIPEGTPVFANEPLISITGPSIDVQIFETYLLNVMNLQTLIPTKAARMVYAYVGVLVSISAHVGPTDGMQAYLRHAPRSSVESVPAR